MASATDRERDALARDARDRWRLKVIDAVLVECLDALVSHAGPLEQPGRRWSPGEVIDDLIAHREAIRLELARLRGPVVIEDDEGWP